MNWSILPLLKGLCVTQLLQWFVAEQIEEEAQTKNILDKIHLIGDDKGLYLFDRDIQQPSKGIK
jgi:ferritin